MPETDVFVPLSDGVRLAATLYLPETAGPWPALLEAYPYRKDDLSVWAEDYRRLRDDGDYAVCRLDVRGTGSSEGVATDEYPPQEAHDLCEVIAWLAAQEWCTGSVGMYGTSYSGFNAIQTAMLRPPALKAIVAIYATDDRYTDDIHFGGGIRKAMEFGYPLNMVSMNALPPVPALAGDDWRRLWLERIDTLEPWFSSIEEQNDGPYWRRGSLRPDYHLIDVPTMVVAGWADTYRNAMLRLVRHLEVPKRLLMGPWGHLWPNESIPGPRFDLHFELIRWFDRWLRGIENGVDEEPPLAFFIQRATTPEPDLDEVRGDWRYEPAWPLERSRELELRLLDAGRPGRHAHGAEEALAVRGDVGTAAHLRGAYYPPYGLPLDQRPDEVYSLVYDWPVSAEVEILGHPVLEVTLRSSQPVAFLSPKLCEVLADGTSVLVSRGVFNLTHRDSHTMPERLVPGETYEVSIELDATAWVFEPGNRIRLAIAGADWPNAWPPPEASELTIVIDRTRLVLPHVVGEPPIAEPPQFTPVAGSTRAMPAVNPAEASWRIEHDVYEREKRVIVEMRSETLLEDGSRAVMSNRVRAGVKPATPGDAWVESTSDSEVEWPEVTARAIARLVLRSDATSYHFDLELEVFEDAQLLARRRWETVTPRLLQ